MAYTTPSTQPTGTLITSTMYKAHLVDNIKFLHGPPTVKVSAPAGSSLASVGGTTWEEVSFTVEDWDTNNMWSSTAPTKVFCRTAGKYLITASGGFTESSTAGDARGTGVRVNSTAGEPAKGLASMYEGDLLTGAAMRVPFTVSGMVSLTTGQFVQMVFFQNSGVALKLSTSHRQPVLSMIWMSS